MPSLDKLPKIVIPSLEQVEGAAVSNVSGSAVVMEYVPALDLEYLRNLG